MTKYVFDGVGLAESLYVSRANISNLINVLLDKRLIKQVEDPTDRRKKRLTLSQKGEELIANMQPQRFRFNAEMLIAFNEPQKKALLESLQTIHSKLILKCDQRGEII